MKKFFIDDLTANYFCKSWYNDSIIVGYQDSNDNLNRITLSKNNYRTFVKYMKKANMKIIYITKI